MPTKKNLEDFSRFGWSTNRPGARSTFGVFFVTYFSLLFPVIPYLGPSQVDRDHFQFSPVWPQGSKNPLFWKSFWWNYVIANIKVLQRHKWSDKSEILHGVSWHIGEAIIIIFWAYCLSVVKYHPQHTTKDKKMSVRLTNCHQRL